jgi:hypothetical protein
MERHAQVALAAEDWVEPGEGGARRLRLEARLHQLAEGAAFGARPVREAKSVDHLQAGQVRLDEQPHLPVLRVEHEAQRLEIDEQRVGRDVVGPEDFVVDQVGRHRTEVAAVEHDVAAQLAQAAAAQVAQQQPEAFVIELRVAVAFEVKLVAVAVGLGLPAVGRPEQLERRVGRDELHHRARVARRGRVEREARPPRSDFLHDDADARLRHARVAQCLEDRGWKLGSSGANRNKRPQDGEALEKAGHSRYY